MKKIVALLLAVMMVFALCACGGGDNKDDSQKTLVVGIDPEYPPAGRWKSSLSTGITSSLSSTARNVTASGPA